MSVVVDCTDFCTHFFIDYSGDSENRVLAPLVYISLMHCEDLIPLWGETYLQALTHMCMHVYMYKSLEWRQPNRVGQFGKGLKPWKESPQRPFTTLLVRLDPQKSKRMLIRDICYLSHSISCTVFFDCTSLTKSSWQGLEYSYLKTSLSAGRLASLFTRSRVMWKKPFWDALICELLFSFGKR